MEIVPYIVYFALALWIIPTYVGKKRKLGYTKTLLISLFLSPIIGLIVALMTPKIENNGAI